MAILTNIRLKDIIIAYLAHS